MKKKVILGGLIGFAAGFLIQALGVVKLDSVTMALSAGSANFIIIAWAVTLGFAVVCAIAGALIGLLWNK